MKHVSCIATICACRSAGGLVNTSPQLKKELDEQLNRLAQKFKLPNTDVVSKLDVQFEKPDVESSVGALLEGKNLDQLMKQEQSRLAIFCFVL